jgi:hypothetical protein
MNIETRFSIHLQDITWPTEAQKNNEHWNVSGVFKEKLQSRNLNLSTVYVSNA